MPIPAIRTPLHPPNAGMDRQCPEPPIKSPSNPESCQAGVGVETWRRECPDIGAAVPAIYIRARRSDAWSRRQQAPRNAKENDRCADNAEARVSRGPGIGTAGDLSTPTRAGIEAQACAESSTSCQRKGVATGKPSAARRRAMHTKNAADRQHAGLRSGSSIRLFRGPDAAVPGRGDPQNP